MRFAPPISRRLLGSRVLAEIEAEHRLPTMHPLRDHVEAAA